MPPSKKPPADGEIAQGDRGRPDANRPKSTKKSDWLGGKLRELYKGYLQEPLPDDLQDLLKKLESDGLQKERDGK